MLIDSDKFFGLIGHQPHVFQHKKNLKLNKLDKNEKLITYSWKLNKVFW